MCVAKATICVYHIGSYSFQCNALYTTVHEWISYLDKWRVQVKSIRMNLTQVSYIWFCLHT